MKETSSLPARIIEGGRGPEIEGTRITVYRVLDYVNEASSLERIIQELDLTPDQVQVALEYIEAHRHEVEAVYQRILQRARKNPPWVDAGNAKTVQELQERIRKRHGKGNTHADPPRQ